MFICALSTSCVFLYGCSVPICGVFALLPNHFACISGQLWGHSVCGVVLCFFVAIFYLCLFVVILYLFLVAWHHFMLILCIFASLCVPLSSHFAPVVIFSQLCTTLSACFVFFFVFFSFPLLSSYVSSYFASGKTSKPFTSYHQSN